MGYAPGKIGYGTGPAGKTKRRVVGPTPAPEIIPKGTANEPSKTFNRGKMSRGTLGKRGR